MHLLTHLDASGDIGSDQGGTLISAVLTAAAATATLTLREGGQNGTVLLILSAVANTSAASGWIGAGYAGRLHAVLAGDGATATVVH
ncbi:MAG: hypothetical protein AB7R89_11110 [Dehalococcoidia bacterium]